MDIVCKLLSAIFNTSDCLHMVAWAFVQVVQPKEVSALATVAKTIDFKYYLIFNLDGYFPYKLNLLKTSTKLCIIISEFGHLRVVFSFCTAEH